jgi:hypothetical protein
MRRLFILLLFIQVILSGNTLLAQIETEWLDTTVTAGQKELGYFFTNRKPVESEEGEIVTFRNRWIRQTKTLYFCRYDFEDQAMYPKYMATKTSSRKKFPTQTLENNFFYQVYQDLRINNGIRNFVFIIPGHAKTFRKQLEDYMLRLKHEYADSLKNTAFITFAWSSESIGPLYYRGQRAADASSNDFAIFQHMLESFMADSAFWQAHPKDLSIKLVCTSMGNELLRRYLIKREMQGIPLVRVYDRIILIGSDAPADAFNRGEGFDNMLKLTESVLILVNRRDGPLTLSQYMNLEGRMGKSGPTSWVKLPGEIVVRDVTNLIAWEDLPALGHDYFLRNTVLMNYILHQQLSDELPSDIYDLVD